MSADELKKAQKAWHDALSDLEEHARLTEGLRQESVQAENRYARAFNQLPQLREKAREAVERWAQLVREEAQDELGRAAAAAVAGAQEDVRLGLELLQKKRQQDEQDRLAAQRTEEEISRLLREGTG